MISEKTISARDAASLATGRGMIFLAGCTCEPRAILEVVAQQPDLWQNQTLVGAFIPGVNDRDFTQFGINTTVQSIFATPGMRPGSDKGRLQLLPLHYSSFWNYLSQPGLVEIVYLEVPPPASDGSFGLGLNADFSLAPIDAGAKLIGVINAEMPDVKHGPRLASSRFSGFVDDHRDLLTYDSGRSEPAIEIIAKQIVDLLRDGDTLQLGLGKVQAAVFNHLARSGLSNLAFHAGMVSTPIMTALENGLFSRGVTTGTALGSKAFYRDIATWDDVVFSPVKFTHAQATFAKMKRFISVNSVLEIDLYGQTNGEFVKGEQVTGHGGMIDFARGARQSEAGLSILALPSTVRAGKASRIVAHLGGYSPVTIARSDIDIVITEHGMADLRYLTVDERAEKLISIADPVFRGELLASWKRMAQRVTV